MDANPYQKDPAQVIAAGLANTEFPVAADSIILDYAEDHGVTQIYLHDRAITNTPNARLAVRQAIGQNLSLAYVLQSDAFSDAANIPDGMRYDRAIEQGPPMMAPDALSMLYQFRDPKRIVDLRPYIALIDPQKIRTLFQSHYISGPNPEPGKPTITEF